MQRAVLLLDLLLACATPIIAVWVAIIATERQPHKWGVITFWSLVGIGLWLVLSVSAGFVAFVNAYAVAHTDYERTHGRINPDDIAKVDNLLFELGVSYAIVCGMIICPFLWLAWRSKRRGAI